MGENWVREPLAKHLGTPEFIVSDGTGPRSLIGWAKDEEWAGRFVACVNALAGVPNPEGIGERCLALKKRAALALDQLNDTGYPDWVHELVNAAYEICDHPATEPEPEEYTEKRDPETLRKKYLPGDRIDNHSF